MKQIANYIDQRQIASCIYCSAIPETRDHVPSKVFLDDPYPDNLPIVHICLKCNQKFSLDEEYVAILVDITKAKEFAPSYMMRDKVKKILNKKQALRRDILSAVLGKSSYEFLSKSQRVMNVLVKLAKGHILYDQGLPQFEAPKNIEIGLLKNFSEKERMKFEEVFPISALPEVGSRALQSIVANGKNAWREVQKGQYRYLTTPECLVRIVLGECVWAELVW